MRRLVITQHIGQGDSAIDGLIRTPARAYHGRDHTPCGVFRSPVRDGAVLPLRVGSTADDGDLGWGVAPMHPLKHKRLASSYGLSVCDHQSTMVARARPSHPPDQDDLECTSIADTDTMSTPKVALLTVARSARSPREVGPIYRVSCRAIRRGRRYHYSGAHQSSVRCSFQDDWCHRPDG